MRCWAILVAAGRGERANLPINKVFYPINGRSALERSVQRLWQSGCFEGITLVISREDEAEYARLIRRTGPLPLVDKLAFGGETRQQSVLNGLLALPEGIDLVAIHDAARAFVPLEVIQKAVADAERFGSGVASTWLVDTVKFVDEENRALSTPRRAQMRAVQTPQVFRFSSILNAHRQAVLDGFSATDDAALLEHYGEPVHLSVTREGMANKKLTTLEDFQAMEKQLAGSLRIGHGFDAHRLVPERGLYLGGILIPHNKGLLGHSDGDVALHALMDALLGAAGLGDIGRIFPDDDPDTLGIRSTLLLEQVRERLYGAGMHTVNVDLTLVAQAPKLSPHMDGMRDAIAGLLHLDTSRVNIKATTTEHMGYVGRGEGISAYAVAMIGG